MNQESENLQTLHIKKKNLQVGKFIALKSLPIKLINNCLLKGSKIVTNISEIDIPIITLDIGIFLNDFVLMTSIVSKLKKIPVTNRITKVTFDVVFQILFISNST